LAIYGAFLSSAVFIWTVQKSRAQLKIKLVLAVETKKGKTELGLGVSVQNPSARAVHLSNLSFLYPYRNATVGERLRHLYRFRSLPRTVGWVFSNFSLRDVEDGCPVTIEPGKSHYVFVPNKVLTDLLSDAVEPAVKVVAQDALWRNKYSAKFLCKVVEGKKD
jgi:hypothetical protein